MLSMFLPSLLRSHVHYCHVTSGRIRFQIWRSTSASVVTAIEKSKEKLVGLQTLLLKWKLPRWETNWKPFAQQTRDVTGSHFYDLDRLIPITTNP